MKELLTVPARIGVIKGLWLINPPHCTVFSQEAPRGCREPLGSGRRRETIRLLVSGFGIWGCGRIVDMLMRILSTAGWFIHVYTISDCLKIVCCRLRWLSFTHQFPIKSLKLSTPNSSAQSNIESSYLNLALLKLSILRTKPSFWDVYVLFCRCQIQVNNLLMTKVLLRACRAAFHTMQLMQWALVGGLGATIEKRCLFRSPCAKKKHI